MSAPEKPPSNPVPDAKSPVDVIVQDAGVMPPARFGIRALAFLCDYILLMACCILIITRFIIPSSYPGTMEDFLDEWVQLIENADAEEPQEGMSEEWKLTFGRIQELTLLIIWLYFAIGEAFFKGSSLGKRIFGLRSVSLVTLNPPGIFNGIVRSALKSMVVMYWIPLLPLTLIPLLFNKRKQMGHDLLTRTFVFDERRGKVSAA